MATSDDFLLAIRGYFNLAVDTRVRYNVAEKAAIHRFGVCHLPALRDHPVARSMGPRRVLFDRLRR